VKYSLPPRQKVTLLSIVGLLVVGYDFSDFPPAFVGSRRYPFTNTIPPHQQAFLFVTMKFVLRKTDKKKKE
jgi:hypothetical protein